MEAVLELLEAAKGELVAMGKTEIADEVAELIAKCLAVGEDEPEVETEEVEAQPEE